MFEQFKQIGKFTPPPPIEVDEPEPAVQVTDYRFWLVEEPEEPPPPTHAYGPCEPHNEPLCSCDWPWHIWESVYGNRYCSSCQWPQVLHLVRRFGRLGAGEWDPANWRMPVPGEPITFREDPRTLPAAYRLARRAIDRREAARPKEASDEW